MPKTRRRGGATIESYESIKKHVEDMMNAAGCTGAFSWDNATKCHQMLSAKVDRLYDDPNTQREADAARQELATFEHYLEQLDLAENQLRTGGRRNIIGKLQEGKLTDLGYSPSKKTKTRRRALTRAVSKYGKLSTLRKVNAIAVLTKRRSPALSKKYKGDVKFLQKKYF